MSERVNRTYSFIEDAVIVLASVMLWGLYSGPDIGLAMGSLTIFILAVHHSVYDTAGSKISSALVFNTVTLIVFNIVLLSQVSLA